MECGLSRARRIDILWTDIISEAWLQVKILPLENMFCIYHTKKTCNNRVWIFKNQNAKKARKTITNSAYIMIFKKVGINFFLQSHAAGTLKLHIYSKKTMVHQFMPLCWASVIVSRMLALTSTLELTSVKTVSFNMFTFPITALQDRLTSQAAERSQKLCGNTWPTKGWVFSQELLVPASPTSTQVIVYRACYWAEQAWCIIYNPLNNKKTMQSMQQSKLQEQKETSVL